MIFLISLAYILFSSNIFKSASNPGCVNEQLEYCLIARFITSEMAT